MYTFGESKLQPISYSGNYLLCWFKSPPKVPRPTQGSPCSDFEPLDSGVRWSVVSTFSEQPHPRCWADLILWWGLTIHASAPQSWEHLPGEAVLKSGCSLLSTVQAWMAFNFLMLNVEKIELLLIDPSKVLNACTLFIVQWVTRSQQNKTPLRGASAVERLGWGPQFNLGLLVLLLSG